VVERGKTVVVTAVAGVVEAAGAGTKKTQTHVSLNLQI
jgi:hypothetical protein